MKKIISWNVNGIRAAIKHGMWEWFRDTRPDIFLLQEIKAVPEQVPEQVAYPNDYHAYWMPAQRKGYSGVAAFSKKPPNSVAKLGISDFDIEGRVQVLHYDEFSLINCYFPNSQEGGKRLDYKLAFCNAILEYCQDLRSQKKNIILCGDYNIAHKSIDLKNPKQNEKNPGYLPEERAWMDSFVAAGYTDSFRLFHKGPGHYTWWSYRFRAREKDIGWRIDYFCVNEEFKGRIARSGILKHITGSDHCPVQLTVR
jgi:exodeoxyribonuclease-3